MLCVALLIGTAVSAAERPPTNLKLVGDHWTPWDPPTSFPENAEVYIIERGDTLWDLSARFYGDAYLWPQLWEQNRYVLDAHWIYPGDPLVVGFEVTQLEDLAGLQERAVGGEEGGPQSMFDRATGAPEPLGGESDLYCSGYIDRLDRVFPYRIVGSEHQSLGPTLVKGRARRRAVDSLHAPTTRVGLASGDIVYVSAGSMAGLAPGDLFSVVSARHKVNHPATGELLGRLYRYLGRVRVLSVQDSTAIGEIVYSCDPIQVGDYMEPFVEEPIPLRRVGPMRGVNDPVSEHALDGAPTIVLSSDDIVSLGQNHLVYVDRGADQDVTPGDLYTIYRRSAVGLPPIVIGELAILSVHETSSVARILQSRYTIFVGDVLQPK